MAINPQKQAAKKFVEYWTFNRPGSEKSGCQQYWNMLLGELLGMGDLASSIRYEVPVQLKGSTKYLDAWIPSTHVLIEQKSRGVKLDAPQPGHDNMTPFEQAKFYDDHRPYDEKARWIVTSNFDEIWIYDQAKPLDPPEKITLGSLPKEVHRLAFLVNTEVKKVAKRELEISVQAGKIVGTLYDALLREYAEPDSPETLKALNKLCVRLVFCFYAEDADIFDKNIFQKLVTATAAGDLRRKLLTLFQVLDTPTDKRDKYLEPELAAFPYTNGGLYKDATEDEIPPMTEEIKRLLISSSDFDWNGINTTIFGALFESTLNPVTRRAGGMVYTSSENIHKLIDPLFLNDLERRFEEIVGRGGAVSAAPLSKEQRRKLLELQDYIASLLFLDPASGSGNFLTETYTSLRRLENRIIAAIQGDQPELDLGLRVKVSINQFFGLEINDFAVTVAKTAMWITEAKMARETADILHRDADFLPLKDYDGIVEGNALRMDWATLLRRTGQVPEARFNYIIGNPPFVGYSNQTEGQKSDMMSVYVDEKGKPYKTAGKIDYVAAWYRKACDLIHGSPTRAAFVSTNSITQGEQVAAVWKSLVERFGLEIDFAWRTFRWDNESFEKAHVHCVIIGFHCADSATKGAQGGRKVLFKEDGVRTEAKHINAYLMDAADVFLPSRRSAIESIPDVTNGSKPVDGGHFFLSPEERRSLIATEPESQRFVCRVFGGDEYINNGERYCLWLVDATPTDLRKMPQVMKRISAVRDFRMASTKADTRKSANRPALFQQIRQPRSPYLVIPRVSSERRDYLPLGFLQPDTIVTDLIQFVPNATLYHFGVLTSSVHMAWMRTVCGRLKSDYRYSAAIVYNNFPWPFASSLCPPCGEKTECANDKNGQTDCDIEAFLCGEPVARLTGHEFEGVKGFADIVCAVYDSYAGVKWEARHPKIGAVRLSRNGINDSLHHGYGRMKLAAFAAVPQVISQGVIVRETENWKGRGYRSYVVAAPVEIGGVPYCAFVVVNRMVNGDLNFYLHEVGKIADLKKCVGGMRTGFSDHSALSRTPGGKKLAEGLRAGLSSSGGEVVPSLGDIKSLAFSIFGVKGARNVSGASVESELVKRQIEKTAQGILDARALYPDSSLADLYDPLTMPPELRKAHAANDAAVLKAYGWPTDLSEPEIVSRLFDMYAMLTAVDSSRKVKNL